MHVNNDIIKYTITTKEKACLKVHTPFNNFNNLIIKCYRTTSRCCLMSLIILLLNDWLPQEVYPTYEDWFQPKKTWISINHIL